MTTKQEDAHAAGRRKALDEIEAKIAEFKSRFPDERKNVGVQLDIALWRRFRVRCLEEGAQAGTKLEELISAYLASPPAD